MTVNPEIDVTRFSVDEIIRAMQFVVSTEFDKKVTLRPEDTLSRAMETFGKPASSTENLDEVIGALRRHFDVELSARELDILSQKSKIDPIRSKRAGNVQIRQLAEWIVERTPLRRLETPGIQDRETRLCSVLLGLQFLANSVFPANQVIDSQTAIASRFRRSQLTLFWSRLRWMSEGRVPELCFVKPWILNLAIVFWAWTALPLTCLAAAFIVNVGKALLSFGDVERWSTIAWIGVAAVFLSLFVGAVRLTTFLVDRIAGVGRLLPVNVSTFGDIAQFVIGERRAPCARCHYELTGVAGDRCPECGALCQGAEA